MMRKLQKTKEKKRTSAIKPPALRNRTEGLELFLHWLAVSAAAALALAIILAFGCAAAAVAFAGILAFACVLFNFGFFGFRAGVCLGGIVGLGVLSKSVLASNKTCQSRTHKQ